MSNARAEVYQSARYSLRKPQRTNAYASGKMNSFPHPGSFDQRCRTVEPAAALAKLLLSTHLPQCGQRICGAPTLEKYPNKPSHTNGFRAAAKQPPASVPPPPTVNDAIAAATPSHTATHQAGLAFRAVGSSLISRFQSHVSEMSRAFDKISRRSGGVSPPASPQICLPQPLCNGGSGFYCRRWPYP